MAKPDFDVAVVGAGPGGLVAALYLRRFLRSVVVLNSGVSRAHWIPRTYNLLGMRGGISGPELLARLWRQNTDVGTERQEGLFAVYPEGSVFRLECDGSAAITASRVVLATGMRDTQPKLDNLIRLRRKGLLRYCPVCDAFEHRGKKLAVLAQDDHGIRAALMLARIAKSVDIVWPESVEVPDELKEPSARAGIGFLRGHLISIEEAERGKALWLHIAREGVEQRFFADACYVELGVTVTDFAFRHLTEIKREERGHLVTDSHQCLDIPGLYAVGDCVRGLAQITVAAAQAAIAATHINNTLRDEP